MVFVSQTVLAAAREWEVDKPHSNFYFRVDHIFSKVGGQFNDYNAEVNFDPKNLAESRLFFEIMTDSVDTNIPKRDKHLQSRDFFDAGKYPTMTFESEKITDVGNNVFEVQGTFTVKGETYDLILPLTLAGIKDHHFEKGKEVIGLNGVVTLDRLDYKVGTGKFFERGIVGKDVEILVTIEALSEK